MIHDDKQLEELLSDKIVLREKLHHWPLSYVEKVITNSNSIYIYKSQHSASSVEKAFYTNIKSPFLLSPVFYDTYDNCDIMILPYLDYPTLENVQGIELEQIITNISNIIQEFSDMPVFFDLSSVDKLAQIIDTVCIIFKEENDSQYITILKDWIISRAHVCYDNSQIGNIHGDLTFSNILVKDGELCCILDWQRPMKAPVLLDSALAFRLAGYDAVNKYGDFGILAVVCNFLWYSYACLNFIPFVYNHAHKLLLEFVSLVNDY